MRILITGAGGRIGTAVVPLLRGQGHALRLLDLARPAAAAGDDEVIEGSATDVALMTHAAADVDLLVHLASHASERPWRQIVDLNIESAHVALEAARTNAVPATLLASSVHAVGYTPSDTAADAVVPPRPDSFYGVSKVVGEALGSVYADRFGMRIVSARIMTFDDRPHNVRALGTWLSPADFVRLLLAARHAPVGHSIVWGVSRNTRRPVSLDAGHRIGFDPQDDAEDHAAALAAELGYASAADIPPVGDQPIGGEFADEATRPLGATW
jgi:nucleoside-diphosphate-sugar epimerase